MTRVLAVAVRSIRTAAAEDYKKKKNRANMMSDFLFLIVNPCFSYKLATFNYRN